MILPCSREKWVDQRTDNGWRDVAQIDLHEHRTASAALMSVRAAIEAGGLRGE